MTRATIPWNINQIVKGFRNGTLTFDNAIQRGFVWDNKRMSLLIDSVIRGYTIPPIYTIKTDEKVKTPNGMSSVYDCIDGKQRCTTFSKFMNNEFALTGLDPYALEDGTEIELNGKKFEDLNEDMQDTIKSYGITVNYFTDITDEEVAEMMSRMNNGKALTGTENARIKSKNLKEIAKIANHPVFEDNFTEKAIASYVNEEVVIKFYLMLNGTFDLSATNVKKAYENNTIAEYENTITTALDIIDTVITYMTNNKYKKSVIKKVTTKTNFITILYTINEIYDKADEGSFVERFAEALNNFYAANVKATINEEYNTACANGTQRAANVTKRIETLKEFAEYQ